MSGKKRADALASEKKIFEALYVLLRKKPYSKISVTEIAQKAKLSRHTFYSHYFSKEEILLKKVEQIFLQMDYKTMKEVTFYNIARMFIQVFEINSEFFLLLKKNNLSWIIYKCLAEKFEEMVFNCPDLPKLYIADDGTRDIYKLITINSLIESTMYYLENSHRISREHLIAALINSRENPIFTQIATPSNHSNRLMVL